MNTERIQNQINNMVDEEIVEMIAYGRQVLQSRFEVRQKDLATNYKRLLKAADSGKPPKAQKEARGEGAAAAA